MQETRVRSLSREDPLKDSMVTLSGVLAWRIPQTEAPRGHSPWGRSRTRPHAREDVEPQREGHLAWHPSPGPRGPTHNPVCVHSPWQDPECRGERPAADVPEVPAVLLALPAEHGECPLKTLGHGSAGQVTALSALTSALSAVKDHSGSAAW